MAGPGVPPPSLSLAASPCSAADAQGLGHILVSTRGSRSGVRASHSHEPFPIPFPKSRLCVKATSDSEQSGGQVGDFPLRLPRTPTVPPTAHIPPTWNSVPISEPTLTQHPHGARSSHRSRFVPGLPWFGQLCDGLFPPLWYHTEPLPCPKKADARLVIPPHPGPTGRSPAPSPKQPFPEPLCWEIRYPAS